MKKRDEKEIWIRLAIMVAVAILFAIALRKGQTTEFGDAIIAAILAYNIVSIGRMH